MQKKRFIQGVFALSYLKFPLKTLGLSLFVTIALNASAANNSNSSELKQNLSIGVTPQMPLQETFDGLYHSNGTASIISEPNYQSLNFVLSGQEESDNKTLVLIAKDYLIQNANRFGLNQKSISDLTVTSIRQNSDFSVVRLEQKVNGLPVYGSSIAITINKNSKITFVASNTITGIDFDKKFISNNKSKLTKEQAVSIANSYLGFKELKFNKADLVFYKEQSGNQYETWKVRVSPKGEKASEWELLIDSSSGKILRAEDKLRRIEGKGMVYKPDPVTAAHHVYGDKGFVDNTDSPTSSNTSQMPKDSPVLTAARSSVTLKDISLSNGKYILESKYAKCDDSEQPKDNACPAEVKAEFNYTRLNKYFDAVTAFYAIDTYMRYVNETLNVKVMPYQYKTGVNYDPHGLNGDDNSHYSEGSGKMAMGQGGVDDAEDSMVVIHELGHGIHDWITHGNAGNSSEDGIGEGTGDYLASGYVRDLPENTWKPTDPQYNWVMRWDGHNPFWPGRVSNWNIGRKYPSDVVNTGDSHKSGQYWSSCNLVARDKIGGVAMDKAFLNGLSKTIEATSQVGAAQAIINAAKDMNYTKDQINAIAYAYNTACTYNVKVPVIE
jgi:Zn-dependent metalloprotease